MTEAEWLACTDPTPMLEEFLHDKASNRKLRLFACACVRQGWHLLTDERSRQSVVIAEHHADGSVDDAELNRACDEADVAITNPRDAYLELGKKEQERRVFEATCAAHWSSVEEAWEAADQLLQWHFVEDEDARRSGLLRDIFGNPFRTICLDSAWLTPTVLALAQAAYDNRISPAGTLDNARLAVLADALEDAGCTDAVILNHCRQPREHYRGCWLVDLLLGKE